MSESLTSGASPNDTQPDPRLAASIDNWKKKLLDLSKRNRALNFRMNRVSTIAIVDEQAPEVFRQLVLDHATLRFKPAPEPETWREGGN